MVQVRLNETLSNSFDLVMCSSFCALCQPTSNIFLDDFRTFIQSIQNTRTTTAWMQEQEQERETEMLTQVIKVTILMNVASICIVSM